MQAAVVVGIDVSKRTLEVAFRRPWALFIRPASLGQKPRLRGI